MKAFVLLAKFFATVGGVGFVPAAPGTAGSLVPCLFVLACCQQPHQHRSLALGLFLLTTVLSFLSLPLIQTVLKHPPQTKNLPRKKADPSYIVLDEVVGQFLTLGLVLLLFPLSFGTVGLSFLLFRLFDITKPWPIRTVETALARRPPWQAVGIVVDDLMAGLLAGIVAVFCLHLLSTICPGAWELFNPINLEFHVKSCL